MDKQKGKEILTVIETHLPELYAAIEKVADYPNADDYSSPSDYDDAVDRAELVALRELLCFAIN